VSCPVAVSIYGDTSSMCGNIAACGTATATSTCTQIALSCAVTTGPLLREITANPQVGQGASCAPSTEVPSVPPATWSENAEGCGFTGTLTSCGSREVCVPSPSSPFKLCVYQTGSLGGTCPSPYDATSAPVVFDTGIADSRSCTDCRCGDVTGSCTGGDVMLSPNLTCTGGITSPLPATCAVDGINGNLPLYTELTTPPTPGGTCSASGGQPSGTATGTGPVSVCCMP
jgi:hypothetical protein